MRFKDKIAIVTGASSGIGHAVAQALLLCGASVLGVGSGKSVDSDRDFYGMESLSWVDVDVRDPLAPRTIVDAALESFNDRIDILVNAAGILTLGRCDTTDMDDWIRTLAVNLDAPFRITKACIPHLRETKGCVVNVSSINSNRPFSNTLAYSVSKAGLDQLTRVSAVELAEFGVRVNAVNPGVVGTKLHLRAGMTRDAYDAFVKRGEDTHPLGRIGTAEEVADAVLFLADAPWITGVTLPIDGGRHLTVVR